MNVYLDESGCPGFKFRQGSKRFSVVTMLFVDEPTPIETGIAALRQQLRVGPTYEFSFHGSSNRMREQFLRMLVRHPIQIRATVVRKELIKQPELMNSKGFYRFLLQLVVQHHSAALEGNRLIIDRSAEHQKEQRLLRSSIRQALNAGREGRQIKDISQRDSAEDDLLQAVDMVCGAINRAYVSGERQFLDLIQIRIEELVEWP